MCILRGESSPHCAVYWVKGGDSANTGPAARPVTKGSEQISGVRIINTKARGMTTPSPACLNPWQGGLFMTITSEMTRISVTIFWLTGEVGLSRGRPGECSWNVFTRHPVVGSCPGRFGHRICPSWLEIVMVFSRLLLVLECSEATGVAAGLDTFPPNDTAD